MLNENMLQMFVDTSQLSSDPSEKYASNICRLRMFSHRKNTQLWMIVLIEGFALRR